MFNLLSMIFNFKNYDLKKYNFAMLTVVITLMSVGAYLIRLVQAEDENLFQKHLMGLAMGLVIAIIVSLIDYHFICKFYIIL
ncbi:MAG TPA: hypothetical protein GXZ21_01015, partial [Clostridiales bacterium]|nr:hypothetical protein [Clostridiales bacterium]